MKLENQIGAVLRTYGRRVAVSDGTWRSMPFRAFIQPVRYKNKMYLQDARTEIGLADSDYFLYIGPSVHDIAGLSPAARIECGGEKYLIVKAEKIFVEDAPVYIWGVVRRVREENDDPGKN